MKISGLFAVALATLALTQADAMLKEDDSFRQDDRRNLIKTRRGLWIENHYIATVANAQLAEQVTANIQQWKADNRDNGALRAQDDGSDDDIHAHTVSVNSYIPFSGPVELVEYVKTLEGVIDVEEDLVVQTEADPASWGLNRIDQPDLPLSRGVPLTTSHTGAGVNVYVIDTGINVNHVEFALPGGGKRSHLGGDFINESEDVDMNGHGSHCSGTVGGASYGVARDAQIYGVKVLSGGGSGSTSGVIRGVEWAVNNQRTKFGNKAAVLSMSLGGGKNTAMNQAVIDAAAAGHIVVVAAGNENQNACNVSPASAGGKGRQNNGVITVGATTNTDARASYSNFGDCVDIFAPGSSIKSAWKGSVTASNIISGTSMATPHVAGVAAVLLEKHNGDKAAAQAELLSIAVPNRVRDAKSFFNTLLQVPTYTGPPTPPTPQPTMPPTLAPPTMCVDNVCADFALATFGGKFPTDKITSGPLAVAGGDGKLCEGTNQDFTGKFVLVTRGDCLFFDKVKNAENQGAIAVIIRLAVKNQVIFPPAYYDNGVTRIPSLMINYADGLKFAARRGKMAEYGSQSFTVAPTPPTMAPVPTFQPTKNPTARPTMRPTKSCEALRSRDCRRRPDCDYVRYGNARRKSCMAVEEMECENLRGRDCKRQAECSWGRYGETRRSICIRTDQIPTKAPTQSPVYTPPECSVETYEEADAICENLGMRLCTRRDLIRDGPDPDETCSFDNEYVWTRHRCRRGKGHKAVQSGGRRTRCYWNTEPMPVRCCRN